MKKQSFLKGAVIISAGGIAAKILGAFYRIPLANLLGGQGMGVYQMVYPLYCLLLTLSATGIPAGLARIVSRRAADGQEVRGVLFSALSLFCAVGAAGSLVMFLAAPLFAAAQGEPAAASAYRALAPSVFFVSAISCVRGWFQGRSSFLPTALSEVLEQLVKVGLGLALPALFPARAVQMALLAVTASEFAACAWLLLQCRQRRPLYRERAGRVSPSQLLRVTVPVAVAAGVLPLSNIIESILIVRIVGSYAANATALYGLYAGSAVTLINLPVSVCYGIAAAIVPSVSAAQVTGGAAAAERRALPAAKYTLFIALPSSAFLFAFAGQTARFLYPSVAGEEGEMLAALVRALAGGAALLSLVQTFSAVLTGRGKPKVAALSMTAACAVKLALEAVLLRDAQISVLGAAYASLGCYFVALLVNLLYSIREAKNRLRFLRHAAGFSLAAAGSVCAALPAARVHVLLALAVSAAVYLAVTFLGGAFSARELDIFRRKKHDPYHRLGV